MQHPAEHAVEKLQVLSVFAFCFQLIPEQSQQPQAKVM